MSKQRSERETRARAGRAFRVVFSSALTLSTAAVAAVVALASAGCGDDGFEGSTFPPRDSDGIFGEDNFGAGGSGGDDGQFLTGGSGGGSQLPSGCAVDTYPGEVVPLDMHLMLDRSSSMKDGSPPKWGEITEAITSFMALPTSDELGMSMAIFPVARSQPAPSSCASDADCMPFSDQCVEGTCVVHDPEDATSCWSHDYRDPVVPMGTLSQVAPKVAASMTEIQVMGYTPMAPALSGAVEYASQWAASTPEHITIVVLATDGYPTKCAMQDIDEVAGIAGGAFQEAGIKTFVIGIGDGLENLNLIAQKGGTGEAVMVDDGNAGEEFLAALNLIRGSMRCTYKVPVPSSGEADLNQLNVGITPHAGEQEIVPRVGSEAECGDEPGYYLDDPQEPEQLTLCPASCQRATETNADVQVVIGCGAVIK